MYFWRQVEVCGFIIGMRSKRLNPRVLIQDTVHDLTSCSFPLGNLEKTGSVGNPLIGGPFTLIDTEGRQFSDKVLLGKYYLIYFGFTHCPDICPEELSKIGEAVELVKREKGKIGIEGQLVPVFITCDPERDTPDIIKNYLKGISGIRDNLFEIYLCFSFRFWR